MPKKLTPQQAKALLIADGMDFTQDFHVLGSSAVQALADTAKRAGYRKSKTAPGSTARMFYQYLSRVEPVVRGAGELTPAERRAYQARARTHHSTIKGQSTTYTVHGHTENRDGTKASFWTRTGLSKVAAQKLAKEQRAEHGGVARIVADEGAARHHSTMKTPKAQLDREIAEVTGVGTWKKSDQPYDSEHLDAGNAGARVQPTSGGVGEFYEWTIWIGPKGRRVLHQSGTARTRTSAKHTAQQKLAALRMPRAHHSTMKPSYEEDMAALEKKHAGVKRGGSLRAGHAPVAPKLSTAKRVPKTRVIYVVQGNYGYGHGWEDLTAEDTRAAGKEQLRTYRANESAPFRLIKRREKIAT